MSIVEKAISKLQQARADRGSSATHAGIAATPREPLAPVAPLPAGDRPRRLITPARRVELDLELLRRHGLVAAAELAGRLTDQYRRIKWKLLARALGQETEAVPNGNLIMVASSVPNEGKTFTAINLALGIAMERDCTVLLIDADVAKAHLTRVLGLENQPGLTDLLAGGEIELAQAVVGTNIEGLALLPAGQRNREAPELFASRRMEELMAALAADDPNRIVLFDSSPVLATNESQVLGRLVGQILLIVRADDTPQPAVLETLDLLGRGKAISLVLNQVRWGFGGAYYGGYGYYDDEPDKNKS